VTERRGGMPLSVGMVTFNSAGCVRDALRAIHERLPGAETIVVDNGSTDATTSVVEAASPDTEVVSGHGNVGFGAGCNRVVTAAANGHVLLLNPDVQIAGADPAALEALMASTTLGLVAPLIAADGEEAPRHQVFRERSWVVESLDHIAGSLWPRGWARGRPYAGAGEEGWASGAALLVRREEFESIGGFDERLFLYYEDRDLSMRYREAGLPIRTTDALTVRHAGGESSASEDTLDTARLAYAVTGWIEYLAKWSGRRRARQATRLMLATLVMVRALSSVAARLSRSARLGRKSRQLAALQQLLTRDGLELPPERYPEARALLAGGRAAVPDRQS
jgi:N-acetylglucosaminyl-diphospho-decaprenol L-rhamnosyltransferase